MWLPLSSSYLYLNVIFTCPVIENFQWTKPVVNRYILHGWSSFIYYFRLVVAKNASLIIVIFGIK
jgi:hypothetical protein